MTTYDSPMTGVVRSELREIVAEFIKEETMTSGDNPWGSPSQSKVVTISFLLRKYLKVYNSVNN